MTRYGIAFSNRSGLGVTGLTRYAQRGEERGFAAALMTESRNDGLACAQAFAAATRKIAIGTSIANIYLRHPVLLAMNAGVLDEFSGQRLILGLGTGHRAFNEACLGLRMTPPLATMRECVEVVRQVLTGDAVNYRGQIFQVQDFRLGFRPVRTHIPIYIAALGPKMAHLAGEIADGVIFNLVSPAYTPELIRHLHQGARKAGRDPKDIEVACLLSCAITEDRAAAYEAARGVIAGYAAMPFYNRMLSHSGFRQEAARMQQAWAKGDREGAVRSVTEEMVRALTLAGPAEECVRKVAEYRAVGVSLPIIFPSAIGQEWGISIEAALETFGA